MLYLLDANVLIDADRDYYPLERVPEFWDWLQHAAAAGELKVPQETYDEVTAGGGDLVDWLKQRDIKRNLLLHEESDPNLVDRVVTTGYAPDLTDLEVNKLGQDPFLIAYAVARPNERWVISNEASRPKAQRANRKVPDVCKTVHVECGNAFFLIRELNFSTAWRSR